MILHIPPENLPDMFSIADDMEDLWGHTRGAECPLCEAGQHDWMTPGRKYWADETFAGGWMEPVECEERQCRCCGDYTEKRTEEW